MSRTFALALVTFAAAVSCGKPRGYVVEEQTRPVHARLVVDWWRRDITTEWRPFLALRGDGYSFSVTCQHEFTTRLPSGPARGLMEVERSGRRVALRCAPTDDWSVHFLAGGDSFALCPNPAWTGPRVPWSRVPGVEEAAVASIGCGKTTFPVAARAVEAVAGPAGLGRFLRVMAPRELDHGGETSASQAAFARALARVAPDDRAAVQAVLREAILAGSDRARTSRAASLIDLDDPAFTPAVLAAALRRCGDATRDGGCDAILRRYATLDPAAAARAVCETAARATDYNLGALRIAVLAQSGERCEAWAARHEALACSDLAGGRECPSSAGPHPCTLDDYRAEIAAELAVPRGGAFPDTGFGHRLRMTTAAGRAMRLSCVTDPLGPIGPNGLPADGGAPRRGR